MWVDRQQNTLLSSVRSDVCICPESLLFGIYPMGIIDLELRHFKTGAHVAPTGLAISTLSITTNTPFLTERVSALSLRKERNQLSQENLGYQIPIMMKASPTGGASQDDTVLAPAASL
jgi:hypothetical protein